MAEAATNTLSGDDFDNDPGTQNPGTQDPGTGEQPTGEGTNQDPAASGDGDPAGGVQDKTTGQQQQQSEGEGDPPGEPPANDWASIREKVAGGDDKILNRLSRYSTLEDALKAGVEAQNKIGSLKAPKPPGKDATPEEVKKYRDELGIPEKPEDYKVELPEGIVLGDHDKPIADAFLKIAHEHNIPPAAANAIIANQLNLQEQAIQEQYEADEQHKLEARDKLRSEEEWGREAKMNVNLINNFLSTAPGTLKDDLMVARLPDGKLLGNSPEALRWLANIAREANPYATITPMDGAATSEGVRDQMATLEKMMGDHNSDYWKGPNAQSNQDKYKALAHRLDLMEKKG